MWAVYVDCLHVIQLDTVFASVWSGAHNSWHQSPYNLPVFKIRKQLTDPATDLHAGNAPQQLAAHERGDGDKADHAHAMLCRYRNILLAQTPKRKGLAILGLWPE